MIPAGDTAPKQVRARATKAKLLDAAVSSLAEHGWSATTVAVVAQRAGVSRGAVQYHFPTREDLVLAAVEQMAHQRAAEARSRIGLDGDAEVSAEQVVRDVVDIYSGELFRAALALWLAAVSEPALRDRVRRLEARVSREAHQMVVDALRADETVPGVREAIQVTMDWARGLGLASLLTDDRARREPSVAYWGHFLETAIARTTPPE
jgi:AcrR family transcriptional regulator